MNQYEDIGEVDSLNTDDNPFRDDNEPSLIGQAFYSLEGLCYLIDNPCEIEVIGTNFENHGKLLVNIIPVDENGSQDFADEDLPEEPEDLMNRPLNFVVEIEKAIQLPMDFCKDTYVEYQFYLDETKYKTPVVEGKNREPEFGYAQQHSQSVVTENFIKFCKKENVIFKLFGFPDV